MIFCVLQVLMSFIISLISWNRIYRSARSYGCLCSCNLLSAESVASLAPMKSSYSILCRA